MIIAILITAFTRIKETDEERKGREPQLLAMRMMFATSYARAQAAATKLSAKLSRRWLLSKEEKKREAAEQLRRRRAQLDAESGGGGSAFRALLDGKSCQEAIRANRGGLSSGPAPRNDRAWSAAAQFKADMRQKGITEALQGAEQKRALPAFVQAMRPVQRPSFARPANPSELTPCPPLPPSSHPPLRPSKQVARQLEMRKAVPAMRVALELPADESAERVAMGLLDAARLPQSAPLSLDQLHQVLALTKTLSQKAAAKAVRLRDARAVDLRSGGEIRECARVGVAYTPERPLCLPNHEPARHRRRYVDSMHALDRSLLDVGHGLGQLEAENLSRIGALAAAMHFLRGSPALAAAAIPPADGHDAQPYRRPLGSTEHASSPHASGGRSGGRARVSPSDVPRRLSVTASQPRPRLSRSRRAARSSMTDGADEGADAGTGGGGSGSTIPPLRPRVRTADFTPGSGTRVAVTTAAITEADVAWAAGVCMPTELPKQTAANKLFNVFASAVAASKKGGGGEFDGERCVGHHTLERAPRSLVLPRTRSLLGVGAGGSSAGADPAVVAGADGTVLVGDDEAPRVDAANGREQEGTIDLGALEAALAAGAQAQLTAAVLAAEPYDRELRGFAPRSASAREVGAAAAAAGKAAEAVVAERVAAPAGTAHTLGGNVAAEAAVSMEATPSAASDAEVEPAEAEMSSAQTLGSVPAAAAEPPGGFFTLLGSRSNTPRAFTEWLLPKRAAAHLDEAPAREAASGAGEAGGSNTSAPLQAAATLREEEEEAPEEAAVASVKGQLRFLMSAEAEAAIADDGGL